MDVSQRRLHRGQSAMNRWLVLLVAMLSASAAFACSVASSGRQWQRIADRARHQPTTGPVGTVFTVSPAGASQQWQNNGSNISGATSPGYTSTTVTTGLACSSGRRS